MMTDKEKIEFMLQEVEKRRKLFESDVYQIAFEVIRYSKEISKAIGDISIDEANNAVIKHFAEKMRSYR